MPYSNDAKHLMLAQLATVASRVSLHSADPGFVGTAEVTGGTYARQSVTWNTPAGGNLDSSNTPVFDIPAGTTLSHFAVWNTDGTVCYAYGPLSAVETYTNAGIYTMDDLDLDLNLTA